ncbi:amino acid adenylation domain-containing protein [Tumebacillus sp. BK434]|uniref:non-ribosomal peptide synthetase n=1 Tax=Tumebacillus sp. BK434 TaxID=2512169 RepID=UPI0010492989|nr:non-ribosomal peptide synthetase [Tumebacillus sp. BK434]TCP59123.1 amino acid adenylation domain-containing protein [Tumebacillus sp. BK434]
MEVTETGAILEEEEVFSYPASFAQQRLWFLDKLMPGSPMYNIPFAIRMQGKLNLDALSRSLQEIIERHETLRTVFTEEDGAPMQVILPQVAFVMPLLDLRHLPEAMRMEHVAKLAAEDANRAFDLAKGPLMRTSLLKLEEEEYVLLLTLHHIISDAWSCNVMLKEIVVLYEAFVSGLPSPLPELPIQYVDFTGWQLEHLSGELLERQTAYWKGQLGDHPPVLLLPTDRPRQATQTHRGAFLKFKLSQELSDKLSELSQQEGATLYMTMLAAYAALLARYTGHEDIAVGTPIAGRNIGQIEGLIGFFVNTLVMRTDLSGTPSFRELLGRVKKTALEAYAHQDLPFERLVEELQPERNMSSTPLFQTMFSLQNMVKEDAHRVSGLTLSGLETGQNMAKFDLNITMGESAGGIRGSFEYKVDLFDAATIERMIGHFINLLEGIAAHPDVPVAKLPLLSKEETEQQLVVWNQNAVEFPRDKTIPALFEEQVTLNADRPALSFGGTVLTYRELNERANRLAHALQKKGVGPDVLVGICMERSLELIIGLLGIVKAGGAYVPLDPAYPKERLAYMLEDSAVGVLLTQEKLLAELPAHGADVICLDRDWPQVAAESAETPELALSSEHLAYMIYTSGSTGKPKGVLIPHRGVARLVKNGNYLIAGAEDVLLQLAAISFDAAVPEVWGSLLNGAKLVVFPAETPTIDEIVRVICEEEVTVALLTTGLLPQLAEADLSSLQSLRRMAVGGDVMSAQHAQRVLEKLPGLMLANAYGPTENSVASTVFWMTDPDDVPAVVPIGRAVRNNELYVLDRQLQPVPVGVAGELHVGGPGLARGYWNRPELTQELFISHPFQSDGARLYKTGDLVRYLPDGNLEFLGRIDDQVKIRGFRIELAEIESVIGGHPSVGAVIVLAREDRPGDKRLVAYVVAEQQAEVTGAELRAYLKNLLPDYMVPSAFVILPNLPLTQNGKVDRRALPAPESGDYSAGVQYEAPRNEIESRLARIWQVILGVEGIGIRNSFFELGGHSLLATQTISRVNEAFDLHLQLRVMFEAPTIAEMAERIEQAMTAKREEDFPPIVPVSRDGELVCSLGQERVWMLDRMTPGTPVYNIASAMRFVGKLDVPVMEKVINEIIRRHESLRTVLYDAGQGVRQRVLAPEWKPLPVIELPGLTEEQRRAEERRYLQNETERNFDLVAESPMYMCLLKFDEEEHVWILNMHHIITDGWSTGVFSGEFSKLYAAYVQGKPSPLPEMTIQYADFAAWQRGWMQGEFFERKLAYWVDHLGDAAVPSFPTDFPRPELMEKRGGRLRFGFSREFTEQLQLFCAQNGITLFMLLLGAYNTMQMRNGGGDDITVGSPIAGRYRKELEHLIGFFIGNAPIRGDLRGNPTVKELLARMRKSTLGAFEHQMIPQALISEALQRKTPLYQTLFILQNFPVAGEALPELAIYQVEAEMEVSKFDFTIAMGESGDGRLLGTFEYSTELFRRETVERLLLHFEMILKAFVEHPEQRLSDIDLT